MQRSLLRKVLAVAYLHALRTWRYRYSFVNTAVNMMLWISIYLLGIMLFVPGEKLPILAPQLFWSVVAWTLMSYVVLNVAGWTIWFAVATGLVEEHMLHDTRLSLFFAGRLVTVAFELSITVPLVYAVVRAVTHTAFPIASRPLYLAYGLLAFTLMALGYALALSALGLLLRIPGSMLDISNFIAFILGGIATPVASLPESLRVVAIVIPYSHAAELVRYGAAGVKPYLGLTAETVASALLAAAMLSLGVLLHYHVENRVVRVHGVKGIGRM